MAIDLPGFGDPDQPAPGLGPIAVADVLATFVDHYGIAPVHVVGHDVGSLVAHTVARRHRAAMPP